MANRLARSKSAYLRQHAGNPVDWHPWGEEALARARAEDKPILLSIGYSACHWCHVMERESFEDAETAALMNAQYVSIKVDREERPDLDQVYQAVVQLLGRSGGWPLTVFLTPDQRPFFGGTYFPPERRYGMPSFREVLAAVRDAYDHKRDDVTLQAQEIASAVAKVTDVGAGRSGDFALGPDLLARAAKKLSSRFDDEHGGFGDRPKFPNTMGLEVLLRRAVEDRDTEAEARVRRALDGMRAGGIWDHLGFGFARYSTDERWLVPHFEKMLYDNALLLRLYAEASCALASEAYAGVARDIATYLAREMTSPGGALYASQDADSEGEEGKFFVWREAEIAAIVTEPKPREAVLAFFGVTPLGNFEHTGATVLHEAAPLERIAVKLGEPPSRVAGWLDDARARLFAARELRPKPFRDEKRLACWNGLAISALAVAGGALGDPAMIEAARRAFADVEKHLVSGGRVARFFDEEGHVVAPGFLDDHANVASAALDLWEATGDARYVGCARAIATEILARFADPAGVGFFFAPSDGETLLVRAKDPYDQAVPSGAATAAMLLLRLGALGDAAAGARAARYLEAMASAAVDHPFGLGQTVCAQDRLVRGTTDVVIVGAPGEARRALHEAALATYLPNRTIAVFDPTDPASIAAAPALAEGKPAAAHPVAYVCRAQTCSAPVATPDELRRLLLEGAAC